MASKKSPKRTSKKASPKNVSDGDDSGSPVAVLVNKPGTGKTAGVRNDVYADVVNEIVSLSENESLAKKVDNGPLSEARGNDTWRLHAQLKAVDQLNTNLDAQATSVKAALSQVDSHLFTKVQQSRDAVQTSIQDLQSQVKDSFAKLAKATAGSEENIRAQTDSFSKAMESLLATLQHDVNRKIAEFRDESTRQIDKRFNQGDVAFAAVRADQEVIKALLTDIIKDRMGRPEPRGR